MFNIFNLFKRNKYQLGCLAPDPVDPRDYLLSNIQKEKVGLPETYDLRDKMTSVERQIFGSCVANATDGVKEYQESQQYYKPIKLSQKFIYVNMKKISGLYHIQGDYIKNGLKSVCKYGVCLEKTFPDIRKNTWEEYVRDEPSQKAYQEAEKYKGKTYWSVGRTLNNFKQAIYQQKSPVIFSMMWYKSYNKPNADGKLPLPDKKADGHAVVCCGWDKDKLWVRNSWGTKYGKNGYFYIPFNEFDKHQIWSAWILLDKSKSKGWAAGRYLKRIEAPDGFVKGERVVPTVRLNLRDNPGLTSNKIKVLKPNQKLEILEGGQNLHDYTWYRIKEID